MPRFILDLTVIVRAKSEEHARMYVKMALERKDRVERVGDIKVGPLPDPPVVVTD